MIPILRSATTELTVDELARLAAQVTLSIGECADDPDVLTAMRVAVLVPEPGDAPHSHLVAAIAAAGWSEDQTTEAGAQQWMRRDGSTHPAFWAGLAQEVVAAGGVEESARRSITAT